jgi:hypothetical protein
MNGVQPKRHMFRHTARLPTRNAPRLELKSSLCESCGSPTALRLCPDCREKAEPHRDNDPYDIVGGEGGGWS